MTLRFLSVTSKVSVLLACITSFNIALAEPVTFSDVESLAPSLPHSSFNYGAAPENKLLRIGAMEPSPASADSSATQPKSAVLAPIVLIHGGCWSNAYSVEHTLPMAEALSGEGYTVWTTEYRRVGDAGGGWPGSLDDIKAAIRYVHQRSGRPPVLVGHSAGGHLALKAAEAASLGIQGVVALAPITDLVSYGAEPGGCQSMVPKFMGDTEYQPNERYREASVDASRLAVPVRIVIGKEDPIVSMAQVISFPQASIAIEPAAGHFDLIHPKTDAFQTVVEQIKDLVETRRMTSGHDDP